jgi:hypothetical protein
LTVQLDEVAMSSPFLFSLEFELALGTDNPGVPLDRHLAYGLLLKELRSLVPCLPDGGNGLFTPGFRFYLDAGDHPEMALVETTSPWQLLELKQAAFALLDEALQRVRKILPGLVLLANNHDYTVSTYWGCHENYAIRLPPDVLERGMLPFLATRHLLAGNGRIDPRGRVLLSARAPAMVQITGGSTTSHRALYSTCRQEPLMSRGPFAHRLHLICGDAVLSQLGEFLKVATTALVLAWLQRNPHGADVLFHPCPLRLLKTANVLWRPNGRLHVSRTALAIQRAYCLRVGQFLASDSELPAWCAEAVNRWEQVLDLLEHEPLALWDQLDPFIKLTLFDAALRELGRRWPDIASDRRLYHQLALLDVAYHRLGENGPFQHLEREGGLHHRLIANLVAVPIVEGEHRTSSMILDIARRLPTRAAARASLIASLSGQERGILCDWSCIRRSSPAGTFALGDPTRSDPPVWQPARRQDELEVAGPDDQPLDPSSDLVESDDSLGSFLQRMRRLIAERRG